MEISAYIDAIYMYFIECPKSSQDYMQFKSCVMDVIMMATDCYHKDATPIRRKYQHGSVRIHFIIYEKNSVVMITLLDTNYAKELVNATEFKLPMDVDVKFLRDLVRRLDKFFGVTY